MVVYGNGTWNSCPGRLGVTYTNTSTKYRIVYVMVGEVGLGYAYGYIDGQLVAGRRAQYYSASNFTLLVPPGKTYLVTADECYIWTEFQ